MTEVINPIPARLKNVSVGGHVAGAADIIDDNTGETLDQLSTKPATTGTTGDYPYNGLGRIILKKNMVSGVNTLTQSMINQDNTIYVIQYDFTLGEYLIIPENCVLEFDGGSLSGNVIVLSSNTKILGNGKIYCPHSVVYSTSNKDIVKVEGSNVEIRDIEIYSDVTFGYDTSGTEQNMIIGIQAYNSTNITIKNVKLHNLSAAIGIDTCNKVKITNCYIDKCFCRYRNIYGYGIVPSNSSNVVINGNILNDIERHAIYVASDSGRGENIIISNNIINGLVKDSYFDYEFMIKIMSASNVIVNSNTINGYRGIMLNPEYRNGKDIKICNNKITTVSRILAAYPNDDGNNVYIFNIIDFENNNTYIENISEAFVLGCANHINIYNNTILCRNTNNDNYCFRFRETTEVIGGVVVNVNVNKISTVKCIGNRIRNFNAYAHLSNITNFYADDFIDWSPEIQASPRPIERIENVDYDRTKLTELSVYNDYYTQDNRSYYHGLTYYKREFGKDISYNGTTWVDATSTPV